MKLIIRTDGGARGNPGPAGAGVVIRDDQNKTLFAGGFYLGRMTNNLAEYHALLMALELAEQIGGDEVVLYSDSELLVRQINGQYRVKNENLKSLYQIAQDRIRRFQCVVVSHVYREDNADADAMVNQAISAQENVGGFTDPTTFQPTGPKETPPDPPRSSHFQWMDLNENITFNDRDAFRKVIGMADDFASILICLNPHQHYPLRSPRPSAAAIVISGKGVVKIDGRKTPLQQGTWIQWSNVDKIDFIADDEPMAIVITQVQPKSGEN